MHLHFWGRNVSLSDFVNVRVVWRVIALVQTVQLCTIDFVQTRRHVTIHLEMEKTR